MTLTGRKAGQQQQDFLMIKIEDVLVSSYAEAATELGGDGTPHDQATLNFGKITFSYHPQNADGVLGPPVTEGWDLRANKKI